MSYFLSLKTLKEKLMSKSVISISGNVDDFIYSDYIKNQINECSSIKSNRYFSLSEFIIYLLIKNQFKNIKYFNGSCNIINVSPENFNENQKLDLTNLPLDNDAPLPLNQFINEITTDINSLYKENVLDKKLAYIIDCSDILINQSNNEFSNSNIANLFSVVTNNYNSSFSEYINNNIKIILISRNQEAINNLFVNKNIELKFVNILKPNFNEKEKFIKDMKDAFELENKLDSENNKQIQEAVSLISDLNFRQILQLIKLSKNIDNIKDFKSLYNMYTFDKKESEWEKINKEKIKSISDSLSERVKGQNYAINQVKKTIIRSFVGLTGAAQSSNSKKPKGILFFAGPTGVGKTELAKTLTEFIFGDESKFIRFDMSEYNHEHSDQKLIGSPPGYVGYETGGQLTNAVKNNPFSILLFDEIEKAHGKILDKFLQILEDGRLTSSKGELIDFSETFIIFTSNLGTEKALEKINSSEEEIRKIYFDAIKFHFYETLKRPEIYNRIGEKNIVPFNFVTNISIIEEILNYKYKNVCKKILKEKNINLSTDDSESFKNLVKSINEKYNKELGGRGLVMTFETEFIDQLVEFIFENIDYSVFDDKKIINISWNFDKENKKIVFNLNN